MRTAATIAGLALVLGGLAGCGGNDTKHADAPQHASTKDFCAAFKDMLQSSQAVQGKDVSAQVKAVKAKVSELEDVGTPTGMPKDAQHGFAVFTDAVAKIDDNADQKDLQQLGSSLSKQEQEDGTAFLTWAQTTCTKS